MEIVEDLYKTYNTAMCKIGFGPLAPQWCTDELLKKVKKAAERLDTPIHVHALQTIYQKYYGLKFLGKTLIEYMNDIGFLGAPLVIGHCVWPTQNDIKLLAETNTAVTHHPSCNLRVRNGISPIFHMLEAGVLVGLGIDGKSINDDDDMIQEMKVCFILHRIPSLELNSPHMSARQVFQLTTENNAKLLGFGNMLGRLEIGKLADLVVLDYEEMCYPYVDPKHDPIDVLLYRGKGNHVHTVIVDGKVVVESGKILTIDEQSIASRLAEASSRPRSEQEEALSKAMNGLKPYIINYYKGWQGKMKFRPFFEINSSIEGIDDNSQDGGSTSQ